MIKIKFKFIFNCIDDSIQTLLEVMVISALNNQHKIDFLSSVLFLLFSRLNGSIINLLFCNCLRINELKATEINILFYIIELVDFIKQLPGYIIVDLLFHLLILLKGNSIIVLFVSVFLILFIYLLLKTFGNLFVFANDGIISLLKLNDAFFWAYCLLT